MVAAAVAAAAFTCRPAPGLGSVAYARGGRRHVVDLATCRDRVVGSWRLLPHAVPGVTVRSSGRARTLKETIWANGRPIFTEPQYSKRAHGLYHTPGPIILLGTSGDRRFVFFTVDPYASASIFADGLPLRVVATRGGPVHELGVMLTTPDRLAWCGGELVYSAGSDRIAWHHKRLVTAAPPDWRPRPLVANRGRAWGSLACAPDGRSIVVQAQHATDDPRASRGAWALWQIGLDGSERRLTHPPPGAADESPAFENGALFFVRTTNLHGVLYALRGGRLAGPFAWLGYSWGYYGHHAWPYSVRR